MPAAACFSYSPDGPLRGLPRMPHSCFSYSADAPLDLRNRNAAQRAMRDIPRMPTTSHCFSYSARVQPGNRPRLPEGKICFSY